MRLECYFEVISSTLSWHYHRCAVEVFHVICLVQHVPVHFLGHAYQVGPTDRWLVHILQVRDAVTAVAVIVGEKGPSVLRQNLAERQGFRRDGDDVRVFEHRTHHTALVHKHTRLTNHLEEMIITDHWYLKQKSHPDYSSRRNSIIICLFGVGPHP